MLPIYAMPREKSYQYSTWCYNVIGYIASVVTGKSLSQLVAEYALDPLGMDMTTFDAKAAAHARCPLSLPHTVSKGVIRTCQEPTNAAFNAGGGLFSNANDLCKLSRFFPNDGVADSGKRLLSEELFADMLSAYVKNSYGYSGLGIMHRPLGDRYIYGHTGSYYGPNYRCSYYVDKKTGYGVVTLLNTHGFESNVTIPLMIFQMLENYPESHEA